MAPRLLADINPEALVWAREVVGMPFPVAALRVKLSEQRLASLESGASRPSIPQLRKIAAAYRRPAAFFYLRQLPSRPKSVKDFRKVDPGASHASPAVFDAFVQARLRRDSAIELAALLHEDVPEFDIRADRQSSPTALAKRIRDRLGVSISAQLAWKADAYRTLRLWSDVIESAGVIVSQFSDVPVGDLRGFSISDRPLPVICANGKDSPLAKIFTLMHELAHVALGDGGLCDLHNQSDGWVEPFCNQVAGEALVPTESLEADPIVGAHRGAIWADDELRILAAKYGVGPLVVLRRLLSVERTTSAFYRQKHAQYVAAAKAASRSGILLPFKRAVRDNGRRFTGLVVGAYEREQLTGLEVSRLLGGVRISHLPAILNEMNRAA